MNNKPGGVENTSLRLYNVKIQKSLSQNNRGGLLKCMTLQKKKGNQARPKRVKIKCLKLKNVLAGTSKDRYAQVISQR